MRKVVAGKEENFARIRIIGVGGSGGNVVNHMMRSGITGVEFIVANTDAQDLGDSKAQHKIHLGKKITRGLGTGMNASLGKEAAEEVSGEITDALKGADLVFISCGMGGGTGTGAAPIIAKISKKLGVLTIGVVTEPFAFEGKKRMKIAREGIRDMAEYVDALVVIPNENIFLVADRDASMSAAFALSDDVLLRGVRGISELITSPGIINTDFADVRTIMSDSGMALMGIGEAKGTNRAEIAVQQAISSPLLNTSVRGARRVLFSIASRSAREITMQEVKTIAEKVTEGVDPEAHIIFGTLVDKDLKQGEIRVTVIATSFGEGDEDTSDITAGFPASAGEDIEFVGDDIIIDEDDYEYEEDYERQPRRTRISSFWDDIWGK